MLKWSCFYFWLSSDALCVCPHLIINNATCVFSWYSIENTITANEEIIEVVSIWHSEYIWITYDTIWITTILFHLGCTISKSPWHRKTTRKDSHRSEDLCTILGTHIITLIDLASSINNSILFSVVRRLVINSDLMRFLPHIIRIYSSWISNVSYVDCLRCYKHYHSTGTWPISHSDQVSFHELYFSHFASICQSCLQVIWELALRRNHVMKIIP